MDHGEELEIDVARFDLVTESLHVLGALCFAALAVRADMAVLRAALAVAAAVVAARSVYRLCTRHVVELRVLVTSRGLATGAPGAMRTVAFRDFVRVRLSVGSDASAVELVAADGEHVRFDLSQLGHDDLERLAAFLFRVCPLPISDTVRPERNRAGRRRSRSA